jgi:hypothetical protein
VHCREAVICELQLSDTSTLDSLLIFQKFHFSGWFK